MTEPRVIADDLDSFRRLSQLLRETDAAAETRHAAVLDAVRTTADQQAIILRQEVMTQLTDVLRVRDSDLKAQITRVWEAVEGVKALVEGDGAGIKKELTELNERHGAQWQAAMAEIARLKADLEESKRDRAVIHEEIERIRQHLGAD